MWADGARSLWLRDRGDVESARRLVMAEARAIDLRGVSCSRLVTAVSELARNAIVHGGGGILSVQLAVVESRQALAIVIRDQGPGIADIAQAFGEGWTTRGGLGLGLPGAKRLVDRLEVESERGVGTTVRLWQWS